ncbi:MAG: AAA family ATPase [Gemmatimonadaceae bacterium]|nr:AAA family ATPase [Gemmatimonadaceae bacterium]
MTTTFKPAKRENVPLLIGLDGASGSGKTYSALLLADGIASTIGAAQGRDGRIFGIDTERGRMLHYADDFKFMHGAVEPPFRPQAYGDAIKQAETAGADVIVIDSFSHCWEGEGGVREWAEELERGGERSPKNWMVPKTAHKRLVNQMLAVRAHIIVCLRSEEKMKIEAVAQTNPDGSPKMWQGKPSTKMVITPAADVPLLERWVPICEKRFPFEITTSLLLTPQDPGVPIPRKLQEQHRPFFPEEQRIGREAGEALARWSMGGATSRLASPATSSGDVITLDEARASILRATDLPALEAEWRNKAMGPHRGTLANELASRKAELTPTQQHQEEGQSYAGV